MPEYLAPGVFVEEVSFRQKTIEGVSTSTTGFVGPARFGPTEGEPPLLTSFSDFERIYGGLDAIRPDGTEVPNYLAHAVRSYFDEGGRRLYVSRIYNEPAADSPPTHSGGRAIWPAPDASPANPGFTLMARHPGRAGNMRVQVTMRVGQNVLATGANGPELRGIRPFDTVIAVNLASPPPASPGTVNAEFYWADRFRDENTGRETFRLRQDSAGTEPGPGSPSWVDLANVSDVRLVTLSVATLPPGRFADEMVFERVAFHSEHPGAAETVFAHHSDSRATELFTPLVLQTTTDNGAALAAAFASLSNEAGHSLFEVLSATIGGLPMPAELEAANASPARTPVVRLPTDAELTATLVLQGGSDGGPLGNIQYQGDEDDPKSGLAALEDLEDISIVAAPGSSADEEVSRAVMGSLITHCERMRYRVAVLDAEAGMTPGEVRELRGTLDSTRAALYYPWVTVDDPLAIGAPMELSLPPSGFMAGIYARNDVERGVHKAPANEVLRSALNFEFLINTRQQEALNPEGINCLRFFEGRGFRVWGARTVSSDPEWKYLNVRRHFAYLERSIERGTQWAVFEPNGHRLWSNVQRTIEDFLYNEFVSGRLAGRTPQQAYFVRCDETTMSQNDRDNGRLVCLIGVAPLYPAEFVIFRIGQKTADARS
ncbi:MULTISPECIES: phage tail sheath subtilisin-like domain-containing protein [unclassified Mameliella]|uniref:phage tail sheath family protein n=1 Tax=unclassified Mameliella TaxID=2630630 RepID=UPI00273EDF68|nr:MULTISPECIES: phage tail sheath subtilisin-like domain-containing protein [unclassified Mameliella]